MKIVFLKFLFVLVGLQTTSLCNAEVQTPIGVINLTGSIGRSFTANEENSFELSGKRPRAATFETPTKDLPGYFQKQMLRSIKRTGRFDVKEIASVNVSEDERRYMIKGTSAGKLKRGVLEKLAKLGRNNNVNLVLYIAPVVDYHKFYEDGNKNWYVYTRNTGLLYRWTELTGYLTFVAHMADVKSRSLLGSSRLAIYKGIELKRKRGLKENTIREIVSSVNAEIILQQNMISADDFPADRLQTQAEQDAIVARLSEEDDENLIHFMTRLMNPGHHTIEEFEDQPEEVKREIWRQLSSDNEEDFDEVVEELLDSLEPPDPHADF